ncbi:hypothetical protein LY76DRAFT_76577 [Colletotrichum caudatum]|nr:hypothetical protein LY76DRAFT_76577 [Colletotrichum caudatum]
MNQSVFKGQLDHSASWPAGGVASCCIVTISFVYYLFDSKRQKPILLLRPMKPNTTQRALRSVVRPLRYSVTASYCVTFSWPSRDRPTHSALPSLYAHGALSTS